MADKDLINQAPVVDSISWINQSINHLFVI